MHNGLHDPNNDTWPATGPLARSVVLGGPAVDLRELRTFVAVVEEGRFSRAAHRLHLSQSAISQTIRGLEKTCGITLLERTSSGAVATSAGELLFAEARAVLARHEQAVAAMFRRRDENSALRVGVPLELPPGLLSGALSSLAVNYPSTAIAVRQVCTARQIDGLSSGELDLGLLRHRPASLDLDATLVADEPLGVLVSETQADRLGPLDEVGLDALVGLDWHGFPRQGSPVWYDELTATLRSHGLHIGAMTSQAGEVSRRGDVRQCEFGPILRAGSRKLPERTSAAHQVATTGRGSHSTAHMGGMVGDFVSSRSGSPRSTAGKGSGSAVRRRTKRRRVGTPSRTRAEDFVSRMVAIHKRTVPSVDDENGTLSPSSDDYYRRPRGHGDLSTATSKALSHSDTRSSDRNRASALRTVRRPSGPTLRAVARRTSFAR